MRSIPLIIVYAAAVALTVWHFFNEWLLVYVAALTQAIN